jgi:hypothetical protein
MNWPLILIIGAGVALRLWLIGVNALDPRFSDADDGDYYRRALRFAVSGLYIDDNWLIRPPLHVFFFTLWLRLAFLLGNPTLGIVLIQLAQVGVAALTIVLGHAIARRMFRSERAGLLFAAFLSLWFSFVEQPSVLFSELLYLFLFLLHVWLLLRFDASGRKRDLALSGVALGAAALTRSPALYSLAFVVLWLAVRAWTNDQRPKTKDEQDRPHTRRYFWSSVLGPSALVIACCLAVVLPWTTRNYIVYQRLIPIDTLGQTNLWLDLDAVDKRNEHIAELRKLPQADRAAYAMGKAREILAADPWRPFRPMWDTFRHIWKLQFVEDYFVKRSFFSRPLRAAAPLGLAGDLIWLVFTVAGLIGLAAPAREGWHNRLFMLAWLGYSFFTVLIFHVEPRYLLPIWTLIGLYGAGAIASLIATRSRQGDKDTGTQGDTTTAPLPVSSSLPLRNTRWYRALHVSLVIAFFALLLTYRDYPAIVAGGVARERAMVSADRAYAAGDYPAAERSYREALAAQPAFVDAQVGLALALAAQGRSPEAQSTVSAPGSRLAEFVAAVLERDTGDLAGTAGALQDAELTAGEDIQRWAIEWLRPPATDAIGLGTGADLGYVAGFSGGESGPAGSYRWLSGEGRVSLPLPTPLQSASAIVLRMTSGRQESAPLEVWIGERFVGRVAVEPGQWREYHLPVPPELAGRRRVDIRMRAPTFVPARLDPSSDDVRMLSLMIGWVRVQ